MEAAVGWAVTVTVAAERGLVVTVSGRVGGGGGGTTVAAVTTGHKVAVSPLPRSMVSGPCCGRACQQAPIGGETTMAILVSGLAVRRSRTSCGRACLASTTRPRRGGR